MTQLHYLMGQLQILYQGVFRNKRFAKISCCDRSGGMLHHHHHHLPRDLINLQLDHPEHVRTKKNNAAKLLDFLML